MPQKGHSASVSVADWEGGRPGSKEEGDGRGGGEEEEGVLGAMFYCFGFKCRPQQVMMVAGCYFRVY